ncbi:hypothetical protein K474DRAFT_1587383, partial [Panus rudis PR-1116 ss-1]
MASGQGLRRVTGSLVPPTPTRLTAQRQAALSGQSAMGKSPQGASVPIASTLVPPTPSALHHPGYSQEKSAFLAPFEMFYDALNDSKQLKQWLGEQLQKSNSLMASLQKQKETLEETVNVAVERKVASMREEVYGLRLRVSELEEALRARGSAYSPPTSSKLKNVTTNGYPPQGVVPDTYTFPPVRPEHMHHHHQHSHHHPSQPPRGSSPPPPPSIPMITTIENETSRNGSASHSASVSPVPFDITRRLSVSATRLDP